LLVATPFFQFSAFLDRPWLRPTSRGAAQRWHPAADSMAVSSTGNAKTVEQPKAETKTVIN